MLNIEPIKERLAAAAPGPWRWMYLYQCRGTHWCLENDRSAALGSTINHHLVTFGTEEYEYDDDGNATRLDQTPDFQLIAHAPADLAALIGEVERLRQTLEERAIDYELLEIAAHNFLTLATFPAWAGEDCRLCQDTQQGHAADCPYALADKALRAALKKEEFSL